jgi:monomeric sarcosine oxidase
MSQCIYDAIVLGAGGVGSAAMWQLAQRGLRVLGIDRFAPPHGRGSSHGQTRIIRQAYFEHADYVPLALESYRLWEELERTSGQRLKVETGLLQAGPADGVVVPGVMQAARAHGLEVQQFDPAEIESRWPSFRNLGSMVGVYERRAGYLLVEDCLAAYLAAARKLGADLLDVVEAIDWSSTDGGIRVRTTVGEFIADRLVIAVGAWAGQFLAPLRLGLQVRRKAMTWHAASDPGLHANAGFPCFLLECSDGVYYGMPAIDRRGLKVAQHDGGANVADPLTVDRTLQDSDRAPVEAFLQRHLPAAATPCVEHAVCLYTMSPDENFIVDRHPDDPRIVFAAGLSGHGFKFTPALGRALAELIIDGETKLPVEFLSLARFES